MRKFGLEPLPGYPTDYGLMLSILQDGSREWREELQDIDQDAITWQPAPGSYSMGGVMLHIAEVEVYWIEEFCLGRMMSAADAKLFMSEEIDQYKGLWPTPPREPLSYYFKILDDVRARTLEVAKELPPSSVWKSRTHEEVSMGWVLAHVVEHDSYHGGQVVMLSELYKKIGKTG